MPTLEVDFEVWCATCGTGLCNSTTINRKGVHVEACYKCMGKKDDEIAYLTDKIEDLEAQIEIMQEEKNGRP